MKLAWKDNKPSVVLQKPDVARLQKATEIGVSLCEFPLHKEQGKALCDAVDAILRTFGIQEAEAERQTDETA